MCNSIQILIFPVIHGWYRFVEPAGTSLPLIPPTPNGEHCSFCQTSVSAWIHQRRNPVLGEGKIDLKYCFRASCNENVTGQAIACKDKDEEFYLYYLVQTTKSCNFAYCAMGQDSNDIYIN